MASGLIGNEVHRKVLRVRIPCPPLLNPVFYGVSPLRWQILDSLHWEHCYLNCYLTPADLFRYGVSSSSA